MDHRLDDHLRKLDEQAIEDGEARELFYCCYCRGYFPPEKMGDVMCLDCEVGGGPETVADMKIFENALSEVNAKGCRRVKGIGQIVRMTLKEGRK